MIKSISIRTVTALLVSLLITVDYWLSVRQQSPVAAADSSLQEQASASSVDGRATVENDTENAARSQSTGSRSGLHQRLLAMTEAERNQVFYLIIRDADVECAEVIGSQYLLAENDVWHVHCDELQNYAVVIDDYGSTSVHSIPYRDLPPALGEELLR
jgi:hypothetical protein